MKYLVSYKHTFGCDLITAKNERQARKKALNALKCGFIREWRLRTIYPLCYKEFS